MADNVQLDAGTGGEVLATDDIVGIQYQRVKLVDGTADSTALIGGDATNGLEVNVTKLIPGSGATNLGKAEDAAHSTGDVGVMAMSLRRNTASSTSGADNDYQPLITDTNGRLHVLDANTAAIKVAVEIMDDWDETNRAAVNTISGQVGVAGGTGVDAATVQRVSLATDIALPAGTNNIGDIDVLTLPATPAGSNLIGDVGLGVRTSGGTSIFRSIDLDETEEEIKATAGQIYWIHAMNLKASVLFLKFYNLTAANTTVGTSAIELTIPLATQGDTNGAGFFAAFPQGIAFDTAITAACVTGVADADVTGAGVNECVVNIGFA